MFTAVKYFSLTAVFLLRNSYIFLTYKTKIFMLFHIQTIFYQMFIPLGENLRGEINLFLNAKNVVNFLFKEKAKEKT
jgi:hypothetical protein